MSKTKPKWLKTIRNNQKKFFQIVWDHQAAGSNLVTRATKKRQFSQEKSVFLQLLEEKYKTYLTLDHLSYFDAFWGFIKQLPQKYGEFYHSINETLIILDISFDHN